MNQHDYPPQRKIGSEPLSMTVPIGGNRTLKLYRRWLKENGLPDAANGTILFVNTLQHNDKVREIFYEIEKGKIRGKRYLDGIKTNKANQSTR